MTTQLATLAQVKAFIGNTADASDDDLLLQLTQRASEWIERRCFRRFGLGIYIERRNGQGGRAMSLHHRPIQAVESVVIDGAEVPQSLDGVTAGWMQESAWRIVLVGAPEFRRGIQNVQVRYVAGYDDWTMPPDVVQACCHLVAVTYKERDRIGLNSKTVNGESISYDRDVPPMVLDTLRRHASVAMSEGLLTEVIRGDALSAQAQSAVAAGQITLSINGVAVSGQAQTSAGTGTAPRPWTPADLGATLGAWFNAKLSASLTLNGSSEVTAWANQGPRGGDAITTVAGTGPLYEPAQQGVRSVTGSDHLLIPNAIFTGASSAGLFIVGQQTVVATGSWGNIASNGVQPTPDGAPTRWFDAFASSSASGQTVNLHDPVNVRTMLEIVHSGTTHQQYQNGKAVGSAFAMSWSPPTVPSGVTRNSCLLGDVGYRLNEVVVTYGAPTTLQRQQLEGYLAWEWGLQGNLDAGHPYKSGRPMV